MKLACLLVSQMFASQLCCVHSSLLFPQRIIPFLPPGTQQRTPRRSPARLADKRRAAFHSALTAALHRFHADFLAHVLPPAPHSQPAATHIHPSPQSCSSASPVVVASGMGCASRGLRGEESQHGAAGAAEGGSEAEQGEQECSAVLGEERMVEEGRFEAGGVDVEESGRVRGGKGKKQGCTGVKQSASSMAWHADFPFEDISVSMLLAEASSFHALMLMLMPVLLLVLGRGEVRRQGSRNSRGRQV
ncbi:unnamed protein product [Closterium sp. NIES-53]